MIANRLFRCILRDMARYSKIRTLATVFATASITFLLLQSTCDEKSMSGGAVNNDRMVQRSTDHVIKDKETAKEYEYSRDMPLIFIGGMPRSGTTLMRAMLDAHPDVRCGEETRVIPRLLSMRQQWRKSVKEHARLLEAGLTDPVIDDALSAFILEIIAKHGDPAPRLCNKDPFTLKSMTYLHEVFGKGQYLLMIRDGRATVHSIIDRKVTITGFDITSYRDCLRKWNTAVESMYNQCMQVGSQFCLPVYYEQLVLHPQEWMKKILEFLKIPWNESVLHHEDAIGKPGGISLSRREPSTNQVVKPVNLGALTNWVGHIPDDVKEEMAKIAPMLAKLGYDPAANPPNYGTPDKEVLANEKRIKDDAAKWEHNMQNVREAKKVAVDQVIEKEKAHMQMKGGKPMYDPHAGARKDFNRREEKESGPRQRPRIEVIRKEKYERARQQKKDDQLRQSQDDAYKIENQQKRSHVYNYGSAQRGMGKVVDRNNQNNWNYDQHKIGNAGDKNNQDNWNYKDRQRAQRQQQMMRRPGPAKPGGGGYY